MVAPTIWRYFAANSLITLAAPTVSVDCITPFEWLAFKELHPTLSSHKSSVIGCKSYTLIGVLSGIDI